MSNKIYTAVMRRLESLNMEPATASKLAGLGPSYIRDLDRKNPTEPRREALRKLAKVLQCALEDLTGEIPRYNETRETDETISIDELDVHVTPGVNSPNEVGEIITTQGAGAVVGTHIYPAESFREAYGMQPARIRIIPVRGTSMEPELWSGQRVMIDVTDRTPSPPGIFVIWDGLGLVLKYVEVIPGSEPLKVRISSAHPAFKPYERNVPEAHINGRVVGVWKRL
jgi:phage repressor protein C with HTH and peptisase S24 domain